MTDMRGSVSDCDFHASADAQSFVDPFALLIAGLDRARAPTMDVDLRDLVERQVVPKLYAAHRGGERRELQRREDATRRDARRKDLRDERSRTILPAVSALDDEVTALGDRLLLNDSIGACDRIDALRIEGVSLECIYLDLLAPTASYLRHLLANDHRGFAETTLAILNLQGVLRRFAPAFRAENGVTETGHRAMLVSPGRIGLEVGTTMFGLLMLSEFFRRDGWDAWIESDLSSPAFQEVIRHEWFDVVEVLAQNDRQLDGIASGIRTMRRGSPNRSLGIVVCGQIFIDHPEFVRRVGADLSSSDPRASLIQAKHYVSSPAPVARIR